MTIRRETEGGNPKSRTELLPEEALYLIERGSLQLWNGRDPRNEEEIASGVGLWSDEEFGVKGAVELSVVEAFGAFMGKEGLTWQRYQVSCFLPTLTDFQAYAYLKRLGYTVQRTRRFIPEHFLANQAAIPAIGILQRFSNFLRSISRGLRSFVHRLHASVEQNAHRLIRRLPISRLPFLPFFSYGELSRPNIG